MTRRDHRAEYRRLAHGEADCPVCGVTFSRLKPAQRLCSLSCAGRLGARLINERRGIVPPPERWCPICGERVRSRTARVRFCSPACANAGQRAPTRDRVLAILERGRPVTSAEIAGRLYGAADWPELHAVHAAISRLRQRGHQIASERDGLGRQRYRLVREEAVA